ncbi:MAG: transposase [Puniceicoccales bacterium]|nr:transposase [Puniceicoccales bacterium]
MWRARFRVGDDGCHAYQNSPARHQSEGRQSGNGSHKRRLHTKLHVAVDKVGHPLKVMATEGTEPDCKRALEWVTPLDASCLLADKAYDSDDIILSSRGIVPIIPPKINRKSQRPYDKNIYKKRRIIENFFLKMKE